MITPAATVILPAPDALPLPAPSLLLEILLQFTFFLHLLAMNAMLGGIIITLWSRLRSRGSDDQWSDLADTLAGTTPSLVAATVTLGVAPLLFLQALMGQFFFTSSIIMGWGWFSVVVVMIFAYYGTYLQSFRKDNLGAARLPLLVLTVLMFLWVAFMLSNNTSLMAAAPSWSEKYFSDPRGLHLNLSDPTLTPRFLHAVVGAVAVAGLMLAVWGRLRLGRGDQSGAFMARVGLSAFTWLTALNLLLGIWYLMALPQAGSAVFMGRSSYATALLSLGLALTVALVVLGWKARGKPTGPILGWAVALTTVVMAVMVMTRHVARGAILGDLYQPGSFAIQTQSLNLVLFAGLLLAGVAVLVWMVKRLQESWS